MKKKVGLCLCLFLSLVIGTIPVLAAEQSPDAAASKSRWAKGAIRSSDSVEVYASLGGQVLANDLKIGDEVTEDTLLLEVDPLTVRAPFDGIARSVKGDIGDLTTSVINQYGALAYLDRSNNIHWIYATTQGAYNDPDNRNIIVGEKLKVYNGNNSDPLKADGSVVLKTDTGYIVEISNNVFDLEDEVKLYRSDDTDYKQKDQVGRGKVSNPPLIPIVGDGIIANVFIENNQTVKKGEALFTLDNLNATHSLPAESTIHSPVQGYISNIFVQPGQQIIQDQLLYTIEDHRTLEGIIYVDEMDIQSLSLNSVVEVVFDAYPQEKFSCMISKISYFGIEQLDTSKYEVTISLPDAVAEKSLLGMHITAYFGSN